MKNQSIHIFSLDNGLTLLVEEMRHVQSASFSLMTPAGSLYEPEGQNGTAAALCDLMTRGAGSRNSREFSDALEHLGVQRHEHVGWNFLSFSGAMLAEKLPEALPLYADMVQRPRLDEAHFPAVMHGVQQGLLAEEDEPQRKVLTELRRMCFDRPWNRHPEGTLEDLSRIDYASVCDYYKKGVRANDSLIGVAGNVDAAQVHEWVQQHFGDWKPSPVPKVERIPHTQSVRHVSLESAQTHIALAYPAVPYGHEDYYAAWGAVSILSGGSSSRLFTEVREKRGLCYSVYAALSSLLAEARVMAYAGTTTERAQETLDVMLQEIRDLDQGIEQAELDRCKARAKSSLIMQQESTGARAGSIARDWFHLNKVNTLQDVRQAIDALTVDQIVDYASRYPARDLTVLTIGAEPLVVPEPVAKRS